MYKCIKHLYVCWSFLSKRWIPKMFAARQEASQQKVWKYLLSLSSRLERCVFYQRREILYLRNSTYKHFGETEEQYWTTALNKKIMHSSTGRLPVCCLQILLMNIWSKLLLARQISNFFWCYTAAIFLCFQKLRLRSPKPVCWNPAPKVCYRLSIYVGQSPRKFQQLRAYSCLGLGVDILQRSHSIKYRDP